MLRFKAGSIKPSIEVDVWVSPPQEARLLHKEQKAIAKIEILSLLPSKEGRVLLDTLQGYPNNRIAERIGCSTKAVYVYRNRGINILRNNIRKYYDGYQNT